MSVDDAVRELDGKKRWLENYLKDRKPDESERYLKQLTETFDAKQAILKGSPQFDTWKTYIADTTKKVAEIRIAVAADELLRKWNDGLKQIVDRHLANDVQPHYRGSYLNSARQVWERIQKDAKTLIDDKKFHSYEPVKQLLATHSAKVTEIEDKMDNFAEAGDWEQDDRRLQDSNKFLVRYSDIEEIRRCRSAEQAQAKAETVTGELARYSARWKGKFKADETIKAVQQAIDNCYVAIAVFDGKADPAATAALEAGKVQKAISELSDALQTCIKEKSCTFSVTRRNFQNQIYYSCDDCSSNYGICYVCAIYCHKEGPFARHKVQKEYKTGSFYCDCGASGDGVCCSLPGKKRQVEPETPKVDPNAALKAATSAAAPVSDFKTVPHGQASEKEPMWSYDLSDRRMPMKIKTALQSHNMAAERLNEAYAKRESFLGRLKGEDDSYYHVRGLIESCVKDLRWVDQIFARAEKEIDEYEKNHPLKAEMVAHHKEATEFADKKEKEWMDKLEWSEGTAKMRSITNSMKEHLDRVNKDNDEGQMDKWAVEPVLEDYKRIEQFFKDYPKFEHPLSKSWSADRTKFIKEVVVRAVKGFKHYINSEYNSHMSEWHEELVKQLDPTNPELKNFPTYLKEVKDKREKAEADKRIAQEKANAEADKRAAEEHAKRKATYFAPYKGGSIRVGRQEVWTYKADGSIVGPNCNASWDGSEVSTDDVYGYGSWTGTQFTWSYNGRYFACYDWNASPVNNFTPHFTTGARPTWSWNGTNLVPSEEAWKQDTCVVEGSVPLPVVLFIGLKVWVAKKAAAFAGEGKCASTIWHNEGVGCALCDNCRQANNFRDGCAVCADNIMFPQHPAHFCKTCANYTSYCARCGVIGARHTAFLCDDCQYQWKEKCCRKR